MRKTHAHTKTAATLGLLALGFPLAVSANGLAQAPKSDADCHPKAACSVASHPDRWVQEDWGTLERMLEADALLEVSEAAMLEAVEDGEQPEPERAEIVDLLIDPTTGSIEWAAVRIGGVLGIGDHVTAVPASRLSWSKELGAFHVAATRAELEAAPSFDLEAVRDAGLTAQVMQSRWRWNLDAVPVDEVADLEAAPEELIMRESLTVRTVPHRYLVATEMLDAPLYAGSEEYGDLANAVVHLPEMKLRFAVLSDGGFAGIGADEYLVPFEVVEACERVNDRRSVLWIDGSPADLERVEYERPDEGVIDMQAAQRARKAHSAS